MSISKSLSAAIVCTLAFALFPARGQLIDFETTPAGGTPVDDSLLSIPYNLSGGGTVSFFFDIDNSFTLNSASERPVLEAYGPDGNDAFSNDATSTADTANGGLSGQLGSFFLRQVQPGTTPPPFIVDYTTAQIITGLHGEIWDIDGSPSNTEKWQVDILDASNSVLVSQSSPVGSSFALDGLPWVFSFSGLPLGVDKVRITFSGTKTTGMGLAFNNFDPFNPIPEPGAAIIAAVSFAFVTARRPVRTVLSGSGRRR